MSRNDKFSEKITLAHILGKQAFSFSPQDLALDDHNAAYSKFAGLTDRLNLKVEIDKDMHYTTSDNSGQIGLSHDQKTFAWCPK